MGKTVFVFGADSDMNYQFMALFKALSELRQQVADTAGYRSCLFAVSGMLRYQLPYEEELMREIGYPQLHEHCSQHDALRRSLVELLDLMQDPAAASRGHQIRFVTDLRFHCKVTDNTLIHFINSTNTDYAVGMVRRRLLDAEG